MRADVLVRTIVVILVVVLVLKVLVLLLEPKLVFFPASGEDETPADFGIRYDVVRLRTSDGETIVGWQLEAPSPRADIVYFRGNGGNLSLWLPVLATLTRVGYRVFAIDYRGYGLSSGSPTEQGLYRDAEAAVRHVAGSRGDVGRPLVYWGRSLGGAVAAAATRVVQPDGLVLESTFTEKAAVIRGNPVFRALNVFSGYRFATAELLRDFRRPVLIVHGDRDTIIPFALGQELFETISAPKTFVAIAGADHNDFLDDTRDAYWRPITRFIDSL